MYSFGRHQHQSSKLKCAKLKRGPTCEGLRRGAPDYLHRQCGQCLATREHRSKTWQVEGSTKCNENSTGERALKHRIRIGAEYKDALEQYEVALC